ncbi:MAG TPA: HNH endonuclease signature motif containing protein [Desulfosporosinus sp.]|nr:HNH endonuclease signature motif containing protein [Desulfosporosinus sp.]
MKQNLLKKSCFSCSICGKIPVVFHHIEEWAQNLSNDINLLLPVCDSCHRSIHGEGGTLLSKDELYDYKKNPVRPRVLKDKLPLNRKKNYSFFIGSNFIENGKKANLIRFPDGSHLTSIDISDGNLRLSILDRIVDNEKYYLIKENELMIDSSDIWDIKYTRNYLKIWKIVDGKKRIFIELIFKPEFIIIKRLETIFNGRPFRIYKPRAPHKTKVQKLRKIIEDYEIAYIKLSKQIDSLPEKYGTYKGANIDKFLKQTQKDIIKSQIKQAIMFDHKNEFNWGWYKYHTVVDQLVENSKVFRSENDFRSKTSLPKEFEKIERHISEIKNNYADEFKKLEGTIVEHAGFIFSGTIMINP